MHELIKRYLFLFKKVSVNGIGTLLLEEIPARMDYPNKLLHAPHNQLQFTAGSNNEDDFVFWMSEQLNLSKEETIKKTNSFVQDFIKNITDNKIVEWKGLGSFNRTENQLLHFTSAVCFETSDPVAAEKIIRKNAEHFIRVGEQEKTNTEMQELLFGKKKKVIFHWKYAAVILLLLGITAILYFASFFPNSWKMQGNKTELKTEPPAIKYKMR